MPTRFIQQMLGHVKLETTQIYTQVSIRQLKEIHTATHPSAKLEARRARATAQEARDAEGRPAGAARRHRASWEGNRRARPCETRS